MEYIFFIFGCITIIKASDLLINSSSSIAIKLKVPKSLIALTIISFGTCAPEVGISFSSILNKNYSMAIANVIGSCIVNILLIIGLASFLHTIKLKKVATKIELPLLVLITTIFSSLILDDMLIKNRSNVLSRFDGIILLLLFFIFILYLVKLVRNNKNTSYDVPKYGLIKSIIYLISSIILIIYSSNLLVNTAVKIAENLNVSHKIITMVIVVIGTSLPELVMTIRASKKKEYEMAIGNIVGTNIFNICIVLGLPVALFGDIKIVDFNIIDMVIVILSSVILYFFSRSERKLSRIEGFLMLLIFLIYYSYVLVM